jgi:dephospho-CoA kinase
MKVLGLTGSIGMGKSTAADLLRRLGVPVHDADAAVHRLQGPGGALVAAIEQRFPGTTGEAGVNRTALSEAVLGEGEELKALEALVHPAVAEVRRAFLSKHADKPVVVLDIPLLFEKGGAASVDKIVVVSAPADMQRKRVLERPGMTAAKFERILALQTPDAEKRARADFVIPTGCSLEQTNAAVRAIIACLSSDHDS